jgi:hypothetical protein
MALLDCQRELLRFMFTMLPVREACAPESRDGFKRAARRHLRSSSEARVPGRSPTLYGPVLRAAGAWVCAYPASRPTDFGPGRFEPLDPGLGTTLKF